MSRHLLRRAVDEAMSRTGMIVGLPKCTVDAGHLQHLLDQCEAAEAKLRAVGELPSVRGLDGREWISASSLEALLKEQSDES